MSIKGSIFKVYIEDETGRVLEVENCMSTEISVEYSGSIARTTIRLDAVGETVWHSRNDFFDLIRSKKHSPEWKCDHCSRINNRAEEVCKSCGAPRSFIYGV